MTNRVDFSKVVSKSFSTRKYEILLDDRIFLPTQGIVPAFGTHLN